MKVQALAGRIPIGMFLALVVGYSTLGSCEREFQENPLIEAEKLMLARNFDHSLQIVGEELARDSTNWPAQILKLKVMATAVDTIALKYEVPAVLSEADGPDKVAEALESVIAPLLDAGKEKAATPWIRRKAQLFFSNQNLTEENALETWDAFLLAEDTTEAWTWCEKVLKRNPTWEELDQAATYLLMDWNRFATALPRLERYKEQKREDPNWHFAVAQCHFQLDQPELAIASLREAHRLGHPNACEVLREMTAIIRQTKHAKCCDGTISEHIGQGACSHHGGVCSEVWGEEKIYTENCN